MSLFHHKQSRQDLQLASGHYTIYRLPKNHYQNLTRKTQNLQIYLDVIEGE